MTGRAQPLFRRYEESRLKLLLYFTRMTLVRAGRVLRARTGRERMAALCDTAEHWGRVVTLWLGRGQSDKSGKVEDLLGDTP